MKSKDASIMQRELENLKKELKILQLEEENIDSGLHSLHQMLLHKCSGVSVIDKKGNEILMELSVSIHGYYYKPGYMRFKKMSEGDWCVVSFFMPEHGLIARISQTATLHDDDQLFQFVQNVHLHMECYYDRKHQITTAKEMAHSKILNFFNSLDYMFVVFTLEMTTEDEQDIPVTFNLTYKSNSVRPFSVNLQSRGIDENILDSTAQRYEMFKKYDLHTCFGMLSLKLENPSDDSESDVSSIEMQE
ncbi:uncharacterized protein [Periplaneta americana]